MATKKETEKPRKFPWEKPNGKLVDDISLVTSINEFIWRGFNGRKNCRCKRPLLDFIFWTYHAVNDLGRTNPKHEAGLLPQCLFMSPVTYWRCFRALSTDVEKAKRMIFRRTFRRGEKGEIAKELYEYEGYLLEIGLKAELLFVGLLDLSKEGACPECGCYAIFRIPGTNRCIVALLHED